MKSKFIQQLRYGTITLLLALPVIITTKGHAQNPGGVSGALSFWVKANTTTPSKLVLDASGNVQRWEHEQSTYGVTQATAANRPPFLAAPAQPGFFNFNPYIQFSVTASTFLNNTATTPDLLGAAGTAFVVVNTPTGDFGSALTYYSTPSIRFAIKPFFRTQMGVAPTGYTADFPGTSAAYGLEAPRVVLSWGGGTTYKSGVNSGLFPVNNQAGLYFPTISGGLSIGRNPSGVEYVNSAFAEVILYNTTLSFTDIRKVQSYLAVKYGITLDTTNYLASDATVIWNNTVNTGYNNNITGIGRDDGSALVQKQSRSVNTNGLVSVFNDNTAGVFPNMNIDNSTTFAADRSFLLFGDDNAAITLSRCVVDGSVVALPRTWKVQKTGTMNTVTLSVNSSELPADVSTLLISSDPSFPTAGTTILPLNTAGSRKYAAADFNGNDVYFTFGSQQLIIDKIITNLTCTSTSGGSITTSITGGVSPYTYSWNTTPPVTGPDLTDMQAGTYTLTVTHGGCSVTDISVISSDIIVIEANTTVTDVLCAGKANGSISVTPTNGTAPYQYSLNGGPATTNSNFTGLTPGLYNITITDASGCDGVVQATVQQPAELEMTIGKTEHNYCERGAEPNGKVQVEVFGGVPPYTLTANGGAVNVSGQFITGLKGQNYLIAVEDKNGCIDTASIVLKDIPCCRLMVPSAFSPNGDGLNDVFLPKIAGPMLPARVSVYNRWGQRVYASTGINLKGWDGTQNGNYCDAGTYFYEIEYSCESPGGSRIITEKGDITLIR